MVWVNVRRDERKSAGLAEDAGVAAEHLADSGGFLGAPSEEDDVLADVGGQSREDILGGFADAGRIRRDQEIALRGVGGFVA